MNIINLYNTFGIPTASEGDKHYREGWVQVECPFCTGNPGYHLGYNIENNYFNCHRCGWKSQLKAIEGILKISKREAYKIIKQFKGSVSAKGTKKITVKKKQFKIPDVQYITESPYHTRYMVKRGFSLKDINDLGKYYSIGCTQNYSKVDQIDLSWRIVAPIIIDDEIVSWQTRDATNKSELKYITCPKSRETIHHKHLLYFAPENKDIVVLTEGIFDVWKIYLAGFPVTCGFGVELKDDQILLLKEFKKVILFLDPDKAGKKKQLDLFRRLVFAGVKIDEVNNPYNIDPGDMTIKQIQKILKNFKF